MVAQAAAQAAREEAATRVSQERGPAQSAEEAPASAVSVTNVKVTRPPRSLHISRTFVLTRLASCGSVRDGAGHADKARFTSRAPAEGAGAVGTSRSPNGCPLLPANATTDGAPSPLLLPLPAASNCCSRSPKSAQTPPASCAFGQW